MRRLLQHITRLLSGYPPCAVDAGQLEEIYQRRFAGRDRERFAQIWCEVANISRRKPSDLNENDELKNLGVGKAWFPEVVLNEIVDYATWESRGEPKGPITTVGELVDWLLDESESS
jgi:hypothetical protein